MQKQLATFDANEEITQINQEIDLGATVKNEYQNKEGSETENGRNPSEKSPILPPINHSLTKIRLVKESCQKENQKSNYSEHTSYKLLQQNEEKVQNAQNIQITTSHSSPQETKKNCSIIIKQSQPTNNQSPNQIKQQILKIPQKITTYSPYLKSNSITINQNLSQAQQSKYYYQNCKLVLTSPILTPQKAEIQFRLDNIQYCVGVGIGLKEVLETHNYDYKSTTCNQLGHGLYIVTSQGYSWSHSEPEQDDLFRQGFNLFYSGVSVRVELETETLSFRWKKGNFTMNLPSRIRQKYTLCFCAYLHEKGDCISIIS